MFGIGAKYFSLLLAADQHHISFSDEVRMRLGMTPVFAKIIGGKKIKRRFRKLRIRPSQCKVEVCTFCHKVCF